MTEFFNKLFEDLPFLSTMDRDSVKNIVYKMCSGTGIRLTVNFDDNVFIIVLLLYLLKKLLKLKKNECMILCNKDEFPFIRTDLYQTIKTYLKSVNKITLYEELLETQYYIYNIEEDIKENTDAKHVVLINLKSLDKNKMLKIKVPKNCIFSFYDII
jgi:hypothetical protein